MSLNKAVENLKFDMRLLDLNLRLGRITQAEHDQYVKSLENLESEAVNLDIEGNNTDSN